MMACASLRSWALEFTAAEGAGAHCQSGAQRLALGRIYNWLDEVLGGPDHTPEHTDHTKE
ncbi:hypothetical protein [Mycobacterium talmoniae]|uniref:hypothetical protein n=1 Tax=Mycobacterium talmoniae TaxID=1858794 RepID=UPI0010592109|nr:MULTISPECIES: hypothetical protein [Mycobacterium]